MFAEFTYVLFKEPSYSFIFEGFSTTNNNYCRLILKLDRNTGNVLGSVESASCNGINGIIEIVTIEDEIYRLIVNNQLMSWEKGTADLSVWEVIEDDLLQVYNGMSFHVEFFDSTLFVCTTTPNTNPSDFLTSSSYIYGLEQSGNLILTTSIPLSSAPGTQYGIYSVSENIIYTIEMLNSYKYKLSSYDKYTGVLLNADYYESTEGPPLNKHTLVSNSFQSKLIHYFSTGWVHEPYFLNTNYFQYNGMYPLQLLINDDEIQPASVRPIMTNIQAISTNNESIFTIVKTISIIDDNGSANGNVYPTYINNQLYSGNKLILIKDTF